MDIAKITDVTELKALAYDQLVLLEQTKANLQLLTARLTELQVRPVSKKEPSK